MRLKISLKPIENSHLFPANYNYPISALIYSLLKSASPEHSEFLHDEGYTISGKAYKLFTFALEFSRTPIFKNNAILCGDNTIFLHISSPNSTNLISQLCTLNLTGRRIEIVGDNIFSKLKIIKVETYQLNEMGQRVMVKLRSPIVIAKGKYLENENRTQEEYLTYESNIDDINKILNENLFNKYALIFNRNYADTPLKFKWDHDYVKQRMNQSKAFTRLIRITKDLHRPIEIRGNMIPFYIEGNEELIKVGLEAGFGSKNSMGFGFGDIINIQ
ncbi:MAG: CRISPR-associated endoribonuclease Cas6 [Ignavibacteriaceae bacterium]|nr:CRISPR-associated endoribonuclease Cas6 [Ignavibacteriaceae bacterium]